MTSPLAQLVKNLPAMQGTQETWVRSLVWEDPPGEGNGNPLQYSCVENAMDRGARWATVQGVPKSQTVSQSHVHVCKGDFKPIS